MFNKIFQFYVDGFRNMQLGCTLWKIILIKLLIIFTVIKIFFFPNVLNSLYDNDHDRAEHVLQNLTMRQGSLNTDKSIVLINGGRSRSLNSTAEEVSRD